MKKIGIIGSGIVAQTLGSGFLKEGHQVMLGSRDAGKLDEWKQNNPNSQTGTFEEAAAFGDIIVLTVKGLCAGDAIELAGVQNFNGKTVIDTCNPIADAPPENGVLSYFTTHEESLMEQLQERFPAAHFVKAFNSVGAPAMVHPKFAEQPSMFICGNNDAAKKDVTDILTAFGWAVEDMGKAEAARAIEPLCMLWCIPGMLHNKWNHAFRLIRA